MALNKMSVTHYDTRKDTLITRWTNKLPQTAELADRKDAIKETTSQDPENPILNKRITGYIYQAPKYFPHKTDDFSYMKDRHPLTQN